MARDLTPEIEAVRTATAQRFYDFLVFTLPFKAGETSPVTVRVATAAITARTNEDFVQFTFRVFLSTMGRLPFAAEQDEWVAALEAEFDAGPAALLAEVKTRLEDLFTSAAYSDRGRTGHEFVQDLYGAYLGRKPDFAGLQFWIDEVVANGREQVRTAFEVDTTEFAPKVALINQPQSFDHLLERAGGISISEGRAIDNAEFTLLDPDNTYSSILTEDNRILYPGRALVGRAFLSADGSYQVDEIMPGTVRFGEVGAKIALTVTSDMSRKGATVAEPVTQRCSHIYKGPGCDTQDPSPTCSRIFDDAVQGCASKDPAPILIGATNNQPSFGGVPRPTAAEVPPQETAPGDTGGFTGGGFIDPREEAVRRGGGVQLANIN